MNSLFKTSLALALATGALLFQTSRCLAIDPLPPEIEKASLEKKAAYWEKMARESGELKKKVAMQRHEQAMVYKKALLNNLEEQAQATQARIAAAASPEAAATEEEAGSSFGAYLMIALVLGGGTYGMYRQMRQAEQPV